MVDLVPERQERGALVDDLLLLIYLVGCLISLLPISLVFAKDFAGVGKPVAGDIFAGIGMALCLCWFWPLAVFPGIPLYYAIKHWE